MLLLLSPAKTLDYQTRVHASLLRKATEPLYAEQAAQLIKLLRKKSAAQVSALMDLSPALAELNVARYAAWQPQPTPTNSKPAVLAFDGDVYDGLQAKTMKAADLTWAQQHLVILSGLYGALRPLDRLQPYRLEMGTVLATPRGGNLYDWWGDTVVEHLNQRQADQRSPIIVNLASIEYARVALRPGLRARVIHCQFEDWKGGGYKIISFFAKKARGLMARHLINQRARGPQALETFSAEGYVLDREASRLSSSPLLSASASASASASRAPARLVFRRRLADAP